MFAGVLFLLLRVRKEHATNILTIFEVFCLNIWWAAFFFLGFTYHNNHSPPKFKPAMVLNFALQTGLGNFLVVGWQRVLSGSTYYEISAAWMVRGCDSTWCNSLYGDSTVVALMYSSTQILISYSTQFGQHCLTIIQEHWLST